MNTLHAFQRALAAIVAAGGAAMPFVPPHYLPWVMGLVAVAIAVNHTLGQQSEVAGDKGAPADVQAKALAAAKADQPLRSAS